MRSTSGPYRGSVPGAALSALAPNLLRLGLDRAIIGLGIGMTSTIVPIYLADMTGVKEWGRLVSINSVMIVVWQLLAVSVNAVLNQLGAGWRAMLWVVMVPAVLLVLVALVIHDSPAYLVRHGLDTEAVSLLAATRDESEARDTYDSPVRDSQHHQESDDKTTKTTFSAPWLRRALVVGIGLAMINQLTGLNIVNYYAPTIFISTLGFDPSLSILTTVPVILVSALAAVIGGLGLIDRFNRRTILAVGLGGTIVFLIGIGASYLFIGSSNESKTAAWVMITLMMVYIVFVQGLVAPVTWLLLAEIFPAGAKSRGMGYSNVAMNLSNFALSLFFPIMLSRLGGAGTYLLFAAINVGSLVFTLALVPETRGKNQM
ncbi:MFS transporter [Bifidobacterium favimelis]|uniref:MFS transporter n=1 Tax=Bifidobacterium favimelis TaxID=3122979 RepID=A0ABU8ZPS9_9BIFI